jgi:succinoglycan biosynthesis protein ExoA
MPEFPFVSIIVPCFNEQETITLLLEALRDQTYPQDRVEIVIADGMSTDRTRQVITDFSAAYPQMSVHVVDNPRRVIPTALNQALQAARGEIIVRLDAHSVPRPDYVSLCVAALQSRLGDNVGGVWEIQPGGPGWLARSIAAAAAHPFGVGDARYRYTEQAGKVDTVPFGAFRKELVQKIGLYDENLLTNEDYEFNVRIRQSGGTIWLDPKIRSVYFSRATLVELARQYSRYGYWKLQMLRRYPRTLRWRQAIPPLFVGGVFGLILLSIWFVAARWLLAAGLGLYLFVLLASGAQRCDPA